MLNCRFIGTDSCGFINGHLYVLATKIQNNFIQIMNLENTDAGWIPYSSMEFFLHNWTELKSGKEWTLL